MQPPKETEAPALPHIVLGIVKEHASSEAFLTLPGIRDKVIEQMKDWQPDVEERRRLYIRVRYCMPTVQLIDKRVVIKEALTQRKTKIIKVYYHV